jgi:hypothetical protein
MRQLAVFTDSDAPSPTQTWGLKPTALDRDILSCRRSLVHARDHLVGG